MLANKPAPIEYWCSWCLHDVNTARGAELSKTIVIKIGRDGYRASIDGEMPGCDWEPHNGLPWCALASYGHARVRTGASVAER